MYSLEGKQVDLVETQKQVIKEVLDARRKAGAIKSDAEYAAQETYLLEKITGGSPFLKLREQSGMADPSPYNDSNEELFYDLKTVFSQVNQIEETINSHQRLNQSLLNTLQSRIKKVEEDLARHERITSLYDSHQVYIESFIDPNGVETDPSFYTDSNGAVLPSEFHARLDSDTEAIKLPTILSENTLIGPSGVQLGKLVISKQLGSGYLPVTNPTSTIERAIDNSLDTFWSETLIVDAPINVPLGPSYYNLDFGAVFEVEVRFDYLTQLNEITLHPFGDYPIDIVAIRYFETDNASEVPIELIVPHDTIGASVGYQFPDIQAKRVRILMNQRHYVKNDFIASRKNQRNMAMLHTAIEGVNEPDATENTVFLPVLQDKYAKEPSFGFFRNVIGEGKPDLEDVIGKLNEDYVQAVSKYEYTYGLYNLGIYRNEYQPIGLYISSEIPVVGNAKTVSLEAAEVHPDFPGGNRYTDIEYYIYNGEEWLPILPTHVDRIESERLLPHLANGKYVAESRFPIQSNAIIMKNGLITNAVIGESGEIEIQDYDASAIYTIAYVPADASKEINFLDTVSPRTRIEEFRGSNSKGIVKLGYYPFVDKEKLNAQGEGYNPTYLENEMTGYLPIKVKLIDKDGYHISQPTSAGEVGIRVDNVTDYFNIDNSYLENYDEEGDVWYQYRVVDNTVQFNRPIPEDTKIIVEYPQLVGHIRVKAIMRRNIHGFHGLTPIISQYIVNFQTLR